MNTTCSRCGQSLHSELSRTLGRCGACRAGEEATPAFTPLPPDLAGAREAPGTQALAGPRYRSTGQATTEA